MKLYMNDRSGNAYKPRLLLSMLNVPYEKVMVDTRAGDNRKEAFLKLNPRGQIPVLEDDGRVFWGSTAVLVYIARKHGGEKWLPTEPAAVAEVMQWLELAQNELHYGLQWARGVLNKIKTGNLEEYQGYGRRGLAVLEGHLGSHDWVALGRPTIADVACYPYTSLAEEAGLPLKNSPSVVAWISRFEALPGWVKRI
ncbi:MAG: glutathione S-transferase family protein [Betaproteobacteria bacterium]|nr:glutathione S-transferase family protein [Betaproteobacteria bacterium]